MNNFQNMKVKALKSTTQSRKLKGKASIKACLVDKGSRHRDKSTTKKLRTAGPNGRWKTKMATTSR